MTIEKKVLTPEEIKIMCGIMALASTELLMDEINGLRQAGRHPSDGVAAITKHLECAIHAAIAFAATTEKMDFSRIKEIEKE